MCYTVQVWIDCPYGLHHSAVRRSMMKEGFDVEEWTWLGSSAISRGGVYRFCGCNCVQG